MIKRKKVIGKSNLKNGLKIFKKVDLLVMYTKLHLVIVYLIFQL